MNSTQAPLGQRVQNLVFLAAGGKIPQEDLEAWSADLRNLGLDSLGYLNLLEGIERTFGVAIDLDTDKDHKFLHTIDGIIDYLAITRTL